MKTLSVLAEVLLIVGALNWGLVGFFDYNLVGAIFGSGAARAIYALVGIAAVFEIVAWSPAHRSLVPRTMP